MNKAKKIKKKKKKIKHNKEDTRVIIKKIRGKIKEKIG